MLRSRHSSCGGSALESRIFVVMVSWVSSVVLDWYLRDYQLFVLPFSLPSQKLELERLVFVRGADRTGGPTDRWRGDGRGREEAPTAICNPQEVGSLGNSDQGSLA